MKVARRMRWFRLPSILLLAAALLPGGASAQTAERRMTADEIRDIARREMLWCESFDPEANSCDTITLIRLAPDGRLAETATVLVQAQPRLQVYIADHDTLDGDRLCSVIESEKTGFSFTLDGRPLQGTEALGLRLLFMSQLTEFEGKTLCQTFFWSGEDGAVREEITVDGKRRTDMESTYKLHDGNQGLDLRPQSSPETDNATVHL